MKRENKLYSYAEQLAEIELKKVGAISLINLWILLNCISAYETESLWHLLHFDTNLFRHGNVFISMYIGEGFSILWWKY